MKSVKPGRGPSGMSAMGSIICALFGILWTFLTLRLGAGLFAVFGVFFVLFAVMQAIYHFKNATGENRHSLYDITEDGEEPDPLEKAVPLLREEKEQHFRYCPFCGTKTEEGHLFCRSCGKKLSD